MARYYDEDIDETAGIPNPKVQSPLTRLPKGCPASLWSQIRDIIDEEGLDEVRWEPLDDCQDGVWTIRKGKPKFYAYVGQIVGERWGYKEQTYRILPAAAGDDNFDRETGRRNHFSTAEAAEANHRAEVEYAAWCELPDTIAADEAFEAEQEAEKKRKEYIRSMATGKHHLLRPVDARIGDTVSVTAHWSSLSVTHPDGTTETMPSFWIKGRGRGECAVIAFPGSYTFARKVKLPGKMASKVQKIVFVVH